jgi:hypothetical protein
MPERWRPQDLVISGRFASHEDLLACIADLGQQAASPVIVATFSGRYLIDSLSWATNAEVAWKSEVIEWLRQTLFERLPEEADKYALVADSVQSGLRQVGCSQPSARIYGTDLNRPGGVGVVIGIGAPPADESVWRQGQLVAAAALGSRAAAFTLDNSLELSVLSQLRKAGDAARPLVPLLGQPGRGHARKALLRFASEILGAWAVVAYEADEENPHRFDHLDRREVVLRAGSSTPDWMPGRTTLTDGLGVPPPPELGGSDFQSLSELVNHCVSSRRRLVGRIAGRFRAYGIPYGHDEVRKRPIGVLCVLWESNADRVLGPYEMAGSRMIALHLSRAYDDRHSAESVRLVTSQLSLLSDLPAPSQLTGLQGCDPLFQNRRDVRLIASSVAQIVKGLANLSGAMSVTCRLVTGAAGPRMSRYLARLHTEGETSALASPQAISLDETTSANAWVATHGSTLYLRTLQATSYPRLFTSPDLELTKILSPLRCFETAPPASFACPFSLSEGL